MQQAEIIPDSEIARLEDELQLVGFGAHDLLKALVSEASFLVVVVRGQQRPRQVRMPSNALDLVWKSRLWSDGNIDGRLINRIAVEA